MTSWPARTRAFLGDPGGGGDGRPHRRGAGRRRRARRRRACRPGRPAGDQGAGGAAAPAQPTGRDLVPARRRRLLDLARRHGFFVLEDSVYGDLRFAGEELASLRSEAPAHVVYIDSLSKTVGGGLRIGWVAASGPVLDRSSPRSGPTTSTARRSPSSRSRATSSGAYPAHAERARAFYRERLAVLHAAIEDSFGAAASYPEPLGGGHLWLTLDLPLDERELAEEAVRRGVAYVPGGAVRIERRPDLSMRLSFGYLEPDQLVEGCAGSPPRRARCAVAQPAARRSDLGLPASSTSSASGKSGSPARARARARTGRRARRPARAAPEPRSAPTRGRRRRRAARPPPSATGSTPTGAPAAQRVDRDGGLRVVVLAPVDQHLALAQLLLLLRDDEVGLGARAPAPRRGRRTSCARSRPRC